ncbi:ferritin-like domain-containing protein [Algoriphagus sp. A40]|uniref:YciE/YciF ferroxidase family protein n=1 Tax=Algoriphagus sp. A40 TaxID=1945863 RepID=UPI000987BC44|nr:ferritin-like domain-containing protein [Algoriphagus sp. A40]OOG77655.1 hypothetical protein B0E43_04475 [Algoriphagus sp. A40]
MENSKTTSQKSTSGSDKSNFSKKASMKSSQLMELFEHGLKDIYWAENATLKAIPKMVEKSTSDDLKDALTAHLEETKGHISRLDKVFGLIKIKAQGEKCVAMEGLIKETHDITETCEEGSMRDAGIIAAVQKMEHYEIATYGTLRQFAETMDMTEVEALLATTLQEEKEADLKLSDVAMDAINVDAAEEAA